MSLLGPQWENRRVLDCFAGSGAFGFEALSRGASAVTFVDNHRKTGRHLSDTTAALDVKDRVSLHIGDATTVLKHLSEAGEWFDVLFFDPPYGHDHLAQILPLCSAITAPNGAVVTEHEPNEMLPDSADGLVLSDRRRYGSTAISIYRPTANAEAHA